MFKEGDQVESVISITNCRTKGKVYRIKKVDGIKIWYEDDVGTYTYSIDQHTFKLISRMTQDIFDKAFKVIDESLQEVETPKQEQSKVVCNCDWREVYMHGCTKHK